MIGISLENGDGSTGIEVVGCESGLRKASVPSHFFIHHVQGVFYCVLF